jgi:hypothetical protein
VWGGPAQKAIKTAYYSFWLSRKTTKPRESAINSGEAHKTDVPIKSFQQGKFI